MFHASFFPKEELYFSYLFNTLVFLNNGVLETVYNSLFCVSSQKMKFGTIMPCPDRNPSNAVPVSGTDSIYAVTSVCKVWNLSICNKTKMGILFICELEELKANMLGLTIQT